MPSANKTPNYELNQWQGNEYPKRQDFVDDNAKIDMALKENADAAAGKISKSLATAASQLLVSTGVGAWAVKTIAEIKALLGLKSAAYTDSSDYETPSGAQAKAGAAKEAANDYTNLAVGTLAGEGNTKTVKQLDTELLSHKEETATLTDATNTNNYIFNTGQGLILKDRKLYTFMCGKASTGDVTIKIDNNLALPLKSFSSGTPQIGSGKIKPWKLFQAWYSSSSNCFFIKASAEGTASVEHVLAGKTFSNDEDTGLVGTMPNQGAKIITPTTVNQTIPAGYHSGNGYVQGSPNLIASNIKEGVNIFDKIGTFPTIKGGDWGMRVSRNVVVSNNPDYYTSYLYVQFDVEGNCKVSVDMAPYTGIPHFARIVVDGAIYGEEQSRTNAGTVSWYDVPFSVGTKIQVQTRSSHATKLGSTRSAYVGLNNYIMQEIQY